MSQTRTQQHSKKAKRMALPRVKAAFADKENILGGARLMILGEAHHHQTEPVGTDIPNMTDEVIETYLKGHLGRFSTFYNRVERLVTGRHEKGLNSAEAREFWDSVAFYNYIPVIAANGPGQKVPEELWNGDTPSIFLDVVKQIKPEIILVCGRNLWRRKPHSRAISNAYSVNDRQFEAHEIDWADGQSATAAHILHPSGSRGWSYASNKPVVEFLFKSLDDKRESLGTTPRKFLMSEKMKVVAYYRFRSSDPEADLMLAEQRKIVNNYCAEDFEILTEFIDDEDVGVGIQYKAALDLALSNQAILAIATRRPFGDGEKFEPILPLANEAFLIVFDPDNFKA